MIFKRTAENGRKEYPFAISGYVPQPASVRWRIEQEYGNSTKGNGGTKGGRDIALSADIHSGPFAAIRNNPW